MAAQREEGRMDSDKEVVMFESSEGTSPSKKTQRGSWAPLLAMIAFGIVYAPFSDRPWGLHAAILCGYSVLTFGLALMNSGHSLSSEEHRRRLLKLILLHLFILLLIGLGISEWLRLQPGLPSYLTQRGRSGSLWDWIGTMPLGIAAIWQGLWMRGVLHPASKEE